MKVIPTELEAPLMFAVKSACLSMEYFLGLDEYERLDFISKLQGFGHIAEMLQSKKFEDIQQDMEIQDMIRGVEGDYERNHSEMKKLLEEIEKQD